MTAALERGAHPTDAPAPTIEAADDRRGLGVMVWISVGWLVLLSLSAIARPLIVGGDAASHTLCPGYRRVPGRPAHPDGGCTVTDG